MTYAMTYASVRKSLQGLDYITASGSKAFNELENVTDKLGELGMGMSWAKQQKQQLKLAKRYLKSDYKVRTTLILFWGAPVNTTCYIKKIVNCVIEQSGKVPHKVL